MSLDPVNQVVPVTAAIPIAAISRLNMHARSRGVFFGAERWAIYAYKTLAALILALDGVATLRFVRWQGKCVHCDNGRFHHWEWEDGRTVACRDCRGTGTRTLEFTETTLPGGHVWHHPWQGRVTPGRDIALAVHGLTWVDGVAHRTDDGTVLQWCDPGEWHPLLPAAPLPLAGLVPLLNEVEDWVEVAPIPPGTPWLREAAQRYLRQRKHRGVLGDPDHGYRLDLGRAPGGCVFCGATDIAIRYGRISPLFHWSLPVCAVHRGQPHPTDPPPESLITPDIRRWLARHERIETVA